MALSACVQGDGGPTIVGDAGERPQCTDDVQCAPDGGDTSLFRCDLATYTCAPACRTQLDCTPEARGQYAIAECEGPMGCACQEGRCVQALCSADSQCADGICRDGNCVAASAATPARCEIVPSHAVVPLGAPVEFTVLARDSAGEAIALLPTVGWSAAEVATAVDVSGAVRATFSFASENSEAQELVFAQVGDASCAARVHVVGVEATPGTAQALIVDQRTGRPIPGVRLQVFEALEDGGVSAAAEAQSGADGFARVSIDPDATHATVSAYHADFGYLTVVRHPVDAGVLDLLLPLERNDRVGGYSAEFSGVPAVRNVHTTFAGDARAPFLDLRTGLFGQAVPTDVSLGGWNEAGAPLPGGLFLSGPDGGVKATVAVDSRAGTCTTAPPGFESAEEAILEGRCGTTTAWAFSLSAPLTALPVDAFMGGFSSASWSSTFERFIPLIRDFHSTVRRDVEFEAAVPTDGGTVPRTHLTLPYAQLPMRIRFAVRVPALPTFAGRFADSVVALGLTEVPGRGAVPLGLGLGVNRNSDALTDPQGLLQGNGLVSVKMAPAHHGLEGNPYSLAVAALWREGSGPGERFGSSTLLERYGTGPLPYDDLGAQPVQLSRAFLPFIERVQLHAGASERLGLRPRELRIPTSDDRSALAVSFGRITLAGPRDRRWTVIASPEELNAGVVLPPIPDGLEERIHDEGRRARISAEWVRLEADGGVVGMTSYFERAATSLDRQRRLEVATSVVQHGRPHLDWVLPAEGAAVRPGAELRIRVSGFTFNANRRVAVRLEGCGSTTELLGIQDPARPREVISLLPPTCGGAVTATAALEERAPNASEWIPLDPPVAYGRGFHVSP